MKMMKREDIKNQHDFLRYYNENNREEFNPELFHRSDDDIIYELKKVILSCERNNYFTIRVERFSVVEDYRLIRKMLQEQESIKSRKRNKSKIKEEEMAKTIPLKDSDVKLLVVDYYLEVPNPKEEQFRSKNLRVLIEVPRIVNKYYLRIFGNEYAPITQIVDGSTYNNSQASNPKSQSVAFKSLFIASRFYRYNDTLKTTKDEIKPVIFYYANIFNKGILMMKYFLAKFGYYGTFDMLRVPVFYITDHDPDKDEYYTFKKCNLYLSIPKYIFDNDRVAQSLIYTIHASITKNTSLEDVFDRNFWLRSLGLTFNNDTIEKGLNILDSLESIYDIATKEALQLSPEHKKDIYDVLIWICREFSSLRRKDNLDISIKRARYSEYFAAMYAYKLSRLYRITDLGDRIQLIDIEKVLYTHPDYLIRQITGDRLINYKNSVNDIDAFQALKYSFKGISGIGESGSTIPISYRQAHPSQLTRLDIDSATANDPGLSGLLCPLSTIHNNQFTDYKEPDSWRDEVDEMMRTYRDLYGLREAVKLQDDIGIKTRERLGIIDESIEVLKKLMAPVIKMDEDFGQHVE